MARPGTGNHAHDGQEREKHNPATLRMNTGEDYHGCLRIDVRRSCDLYGRIEGWAAAVMASGAGRESLGG